MENQNQQSTAPLAYTVNDKAAAFDKIAEAFLRIPAGSPTWSEAQGAVGKLVETVQEEVIRLHPAYNTRRTELDPTVTHSMERGTTR